MCARMAQQALSEARELERQQVQAFDEASEPAEVIPLAMLRQAVEVGILTPAAFGA